MSEMFKVGNYYVVGIFLWWNLFIYALFPANPFHNFMIRIMHKFLMGCRQRW